MPEPMAMTRRMVLSALAYLGLGHVVGRAGAQQDSSVPWQPQALGERIYDMWQGDLNEAIAHDRLAFKASRAVVAIFRGDLEFYLNGRKLPQPRLTVSGGTAEVQWASDREQKNEIVFDVGDGWHCLVSRRVNGRHYASLDGSPEIVVGENIVCPRFRDPKRPEGLISGDVDSLYIIQGVMHEAEAQKFMGWACHEKGITLPVGHPYRDAAPLTGPEDWVSTFVEPTESEWEELAYSTSHSGEKPELSGYELVFEDDFTSMTITDEVKGTGPWWAPVHGHGVGAAKQGFIDDEPPVYIHQDSEVVLRIRQNPSGGNWKAGIFCSINLNGDGNTWTPPFYIEWRLRNTLGNGFSTFPAVWLKSVNEYFIVNETTIELDVWEGRNMYPDSFHFAYHNHAAIRPLPGRIQSDRHIGGNAYPGNMYDNGYHTYAVRIDDGLIIHYFDGEETVRMPAHAEIFQPMFILVDNAIKRGTLDQAEGIYDMGIDYIRVFQKT